MNPKQSQNERQVYNSQTDGKQKEAMNQDSMSYHYVKHHDYAPEDFAEAGETTQYNGIRVVDESGDGESEGFDNFVEMRASDWTVTSKSSARLSDGTILYEGRR